jgi:ABC-2 type transport system ATP-binding protein
MTGDRSATPAVSAVSVVKRFGATTALDGVSLAVARGEMFGVIGPDGAGKTTFLRLVCGLVAPDAGRIELFGADPRRSRQVATSSIGYVSQQFSLYGDLSIDENIEFFARLHGVSDFRARRDRLLGLTGLEPFRGRLADRLSGGMKQKLALACTLVHEPPLLVLDEPTTGVDPVSRREFWKLLSAFLSLGLTIVMATPYLDEAERCGRVALLHGGRLLALDAPAALHAGLRGALLEVAVEGQRPPVHLLARIEGVEDVQIFGDRAHVRIAAHRAERAAAAVAEGLRAAGFAPVSVRPIPPSLEDVFIDLISSGAVRR